MNSECTQCGVKLSGEFLWDELFQEPFCSDECHKDYCASNFDVLYDRHAEYAVAVYDTIG